MDEFEWLRPSNSCFKVEPYEGGARISWTDDPLDFACQNRAQVLHLIAKLREALGD